MNPIWQWIQFFVVIAIAGFLIRKFGIKNSDLDVDEHGMSKQDYEDFAKINTKEKLKEIAEQYFKDKEKNQSSWNVVDLNDRVIETGFKTRTEAKNWITVNAPGLRYKTKKS